MKRSTSKNWTSLWSTWTEGVTLLWSENVFTSLGRKCAPGVKKIRQKALKHSSSRFHQERAGDFSLRRRQILLTRSKTSPTFSKEKSWKVASWKWNLMLIWIFCVAKRRLACIHLNLKQRLSDTTVCAIARPAPKQSQLVSPVVCAVKSSRQAGIWTNTRNKWTTLSERRKLKIQKLARN